MKWEYLKSINESKIAQSKKILGQVIRFMGESCPN